MPFIRPHPDVANLADRAFRAGVPIALVLQRSGVSWSTWRRWVRGTGHTSTKLGQLEDTLTKIIGESDA